MSATHYDTNASPFLELRTPFTDKEAWRMLVLLPLVPVRLFIAILTCCLVALINTLSAWNWPVAEPLTERRRAWVLFSKEFLIVVLWMLGFRVKVKGRENIAKAEALGAVIVFNHVSYVDAPAIMWLLAPSGVGKSSVASIPVLKYVVRAYQAVYFHEEKPQRLAVRVAAPSYGKPGGFPMLCMAPEGTCSDGRGLLEFRTGAFVLGRPVLPVCLKYTINGHNPAWTQVYSELWHLVRLMCQWRNDLEITILPPYIPTDMERSSPKDYAANVRALMARAMCQPLLPQSHSHFLALKKLKVFVDWSGTKVLAPPGVMDVDGKINFTKHGLLQ
ncbi:hypothetical protein VOLCADRAFT_73089 [Volvox carteri f. nagariensis]|uniref:Phospholipid/glycerol acyltransferase domain-containing protein n=1 Tax=Volvox carteri f. nagariensis TaxID=3068 RepID=D8TL88_VOLCA|nr:uncharacterized protein VOLCADRAFT_73089 [Volvox carteri f. nagariensis]EFJ51694.1 hypothetical protein VOLCADRAFT_73089 [Volvox carteri f. nagariensis]|eukprot:XP_002947104.1 hypothetical protein VOLCADRAFT_73089 [Volvox carteri f. nagariensis]